MEGFNQLLQHTGLGAKFLAGSRALLSRRRIGLYHIGNLTNLILNLLYRFRLGLCVRGNPIDGFLNSMSVRHHIFQLFSSSVRDLRALIYRSEERRVGKECRL